MLIFTIRNLRKSKNLSLTELSHLTHISKSYLSKLERNNLYNCNTQTLEKIATALNVNIKDLFYTEFDINDLKEKLNIVVEQYGINSKEALELSQLIDLLINIINKENLQ